MAKLPQTPTLEAILEAIDALPFEDIAQVREVANDKMESLKHLVREQLATDLKAKLSRYNFTLEELGLFPAGSLPRAPKKQGQRQSKGGACKVCSFETVPFHDGRHHRQQGEVKRPYSNDELEQFGMTKVA